MTFGEACAYALTLDGTELSTSYRQPAMKANGRAFLNAGHEPDTSLVIHLDPGMIEWLMATHPDTFWKTPHYEGYPAVLVRYDTAHDDLVREMIASARDRAGTLRAPRRR